MILFSSTSQFVTGCSAVCHRLQNVVNNFFTVIITLFFASIFGFKFEISLCSQMNFTLNGHTHLKTMERGAGEEQNGAGQGISWQEGSDKNFIEGGEGGSYGWCYWFCCSRPNVVLTLWTVSNARGVCCASNQIIITVTAKQQRPNGAQLPRVPRKWVPVLLHIHL